MVSIAILEFLNCARCLGSIFKKLVATAIFFSLPSGRFNISKIIRSKSKMYIVRLPHLHGYEAMSFAVLELFNCTSNLGSILKKNHSHLEICFCFLYHFAGLISPRVFYQNLRYLQCFNSI